MFVRTKSTPNSPRKSIQIVENIRKGDRISQKIVRHVGIAQDESEERQLKDLAVEIIAKIKQEEWCASPQMSFSNSTLKELQGQVCAKRGRPKKKSIEEILPPSAVSLDQIREIHRVVEGVHEVAGPVFDQLYSTVLKNKKAQKILKDIVMARLVNPCSKHQLQKKLVEQFYIHHDLDAIYRMMDQVHEKINLIKQLTFEQTQSLFPQGVELLLFDVTTLYFESTEVDELRQFGYSKDFRFQSTQLVLALATNPEGLPIGYELFAGNCAEVSTLVAAIESWKKLFNIQNVCFIGDRAMFSKKNLNLLESKNYQYIIAAKLKTLPQPLKKQVLLESNYHPTVFGEEFGWIGEFQHEKARLIVSYKTKRALRDWKHREKILEKIKNQLDRSHSTENFISNQAVKKYTTQTASQTRLSVLKIEAQAQWDGLHGVITNIPETEASCSFILSRYARLWKIEESFRIQKSLLKMRPIFHFKPERIEAHIAICYITFSILRRLEYQVKLRQKISPQALLDELLNVQSSIYRHQTTGHLYRVPGKMTHAAQKIYTAFDLKRSLDACVYG